MAGKRIYELTEKSTLEGSDYLAIDGSGLTEARKVAASKLLSFANVADSSDEYSSTKVYKVGDLVIHDNKLYECTTACSAAAWATNQGYFSQRSLTTIGTELKSSLTTYAIGTQQEISWHVKTGQLNNSSVAFRYNEACYVIIGRKAFDRKAIYFLDNQQGVTAIATDPSFTISPYADEGGNFATLTNTAEQAASYIIIR